MEMIINIVGWIGAVSLLVGYLLVSNGKLHGKSYTYQALNMIGSGGFIINSYYFGAMPSVGLNIIWMIIGVHTVFILFRKNRSTKK